MVKPTIWTPDGKQFTHYAVIYYNSRGPEIVACIVVKQPNKESAKTAAYEALQELKYGELHVFETWRTYGYSVHPPLSDSDGSGFVNFQPVENFCTV